LKLPKKLRVAVAFNRDFEGAEADPENRAREDIKGIAQQVLGILAARGFDARGVGVTHDVCEAVSTIRSLAPAAVFNLCESIQGDNRFEALLPLLLDLEGIPYTGSGPFALALALHKDRAKEILRASGVPTPRGRAITAVAELATLAELRYPLIAKPAREDASVGISSASVVHDPARLRERVEGLIETYRQPVVVEEFIEGREINVSILERAGRAPEVLPLFEIDFSEMPPDRPRIVSFEGKWVEESVDYKGTRSVRCEGLSPDVRSRVEATALATFRAIDLRDYGRVDVRLAADGTPFVIDVNPNCDLSDQAGGFAKAARAGGLAYDDVVLRLCDLALTRGRDAYTSSIAKRSRRSSDARGGRGGESLSPGGDVLRARAPRRRAGSG
jgi:D-alanine-D-alanine ligase